MDVQKIQIEKTYKTISVAILVLCALSCSVTFKDHIQQDQALGPGKLKSIYITDRDLSKGIEEIDIKAVLEIFKTIEQGDSYKDVLRSMEKFNISFPRLETLTFDIIFSLMKEELDQIKLHLKKGKKSEYLSERYGTKIKRKEFLKYWKDFNLQIKRAFVKRGGMCQFKKNKKVILKYETQLREHVIPLIKGRQMRYETKNEKKQNNNK